MKKYKDQIITAIDEALNQFNDEVIDKFCYSSTLDHVENDLGATDVILINGDIRVDSSIVSPEFAVREIKVRIKAQHIALDTMSTMINAMVE